jgi:acetyltransferase-like isoleucine patch superfamily enzyme
MQSRIRRRFRQAASYARWRSRFGEIGIGASLGRPLMLQGGKHIHLGERVRLGPLWRLEALERYQGSRFNPTIRFGSRVTAEIGLHVAAAERVEVGDDVLIASWVYITDHGHRIDTSAPPIRAGLDTPAPVKIGDGCWLGERCVVLPGVTLGAGCVVGAGAVVTRSFAAGSVIAGVPARLIRMRAEVTA